MEASSAINSPHPDAKDEADAFFADDEDETVPEATEPEGRKPGPTPEAQAALDALHETRVGGNEEDEQDPMGGEADPTPQAESAGPTDAEALVAEDGPEPTSPPSGDGESGKKSGSLEREYVVLQRVPLSAKALKHLLAEIESGDVPEPRVAFIELDRRVGRNDKQVLGEVFRANRESLGNEATMVGVSSRTFTLRTIKPRQRPVEETFDIS